MDEYRERTVIRFLEIDQCEASGIEIADKAKPCGDCKSYVEITNWDEGCYSTIGFANSGAQMLNLNTSCFGDIWGSGRVVHEVSVVKTLDTRWDCTMNILTLNELYDTTSVMHYGSSAGICVPQDTTKRFCDIEQHPDTDNCVIPLRQDCNEAATKRLGQRKGLSTFDLESLNFMAIYNHQ
ncbi:hypothetical protein THRCLA_22112 [Thraustotheca clavata]|uniref:Peptidase M12A domain-containing protein n=1 Tax=Thraustotheca clavata TaxID=74557 RepID=A0A1V9ZCA6_9STRA|nr:hypothetical protein THRCLA_22112 [Thraustotheca clavata]